ncbi:MAG TPA: YraN family protein [Candidatus Paceibacterota bacterium]
MSFTSKNVGKLGEDIACQYLKQKGYEIVERNFRQKWGEIDVIAVKSNVVCFVEVKAVSQHGISREMDYRPEEMVHNKKLQNLAKTAGLYMASKKDSREFQIDVIGIIIDQPTRTARCRYFEQVL